MSRTKNSRHEEDELREQRKKALEHPENKDLWSHPEAPSTPGAPDKIIRHEKALELEKEQSNVKKAEEQTQKELKSLDPESGPSQKKSGPKKK